MARHNGTVKTDYPGGLSFIDWADPDRRFLLAIVLAIVPMQVAQIGVSGCAGCAADPHFL